MGITRAAFGFLASCDYCPTTLDLEADDKREAQRQMKAKGWSSNRNGEACTGCVMEFEE